MKGGLWRVLFLAVLFAAVGALSPRRAEAQNNCIQCVNGGAIYYCQRFLSSGFDECDFETTDGCWVWGFCGNARAAAVVAPDGSLHQDGRAKTVAKQESKQATNPPDPAASREVAFERGCGGVIIDRHYSVAAAERIKAKTHTITL